MIEAESGKRLENSIAALCVRVEKAPVKANAEFRIKLIADVRATALGAFLARRPAAKQWLETAADILQRALYLRARERRPFEEFAGQALLKALEKVPDVVEEV